MIKITTKKKEKNLEDLPITDSVDKELLETLESDSAYEMAVIGPFNNTIYLQVWGNEGNYPHAHFYTNNRELKGCLRLDIPEYFVHKDYDMKFDRKQKIELIKFLNQPNIDFPAYSNWRALVGYWNANNRSHQMSVDTPMPDYTKLK